MQGPPGYPPPYGYPPPPPMAPPAGGYGQPMPPGAYGYGQAPPMPALRRALPVTMSAGTYIGLYVVCLILTVVFAAFAAQPRTTEMAAAVPLPMLVLGITFLVAIYKMWSAIDDGQTKPSPGMAVGGMFIPLFSIYWIFVAWCGYASRYNAYIQRHGIQAPPLSNGIFVASIVVSWFFTPAALVLMPMALARVCRAVNALGAPPPAMMPPGYGPR